MPHDAEFWKTAGETGTGVVGFLTPIALAAWGAVKKYRKDHPEDAPQQEGKDPCADVIRAKERLEHDCDRLTKERDAANAEAASLREQVRTLYNALDSGTRKGTLDPPETP